VGEAINSGVGPPTPKVRVNELGLTLSSVQRRQLSGDAFCRWQFAQRHLEPRHTCAEF
jgi:hypothetical protein